jgi:Ca-activated chloride channel family protein
MIHLAWPWMLLCLPLPWLLARLLPPAPPGGAALFLPFAAQLSAAAAPASPVWPRWRALLLALLWVLLVLAAMRPQWLGEPQPVPTTGRRLLLAVDVSGSMATEDMAGGYTRLQVVQKVAGDFIRRRHGDQVGLILFGTQPYVQAPLTADLDTVHQFLQEAAIGVAGQQTAIGDAIGLALKRLRDDKGAAGAEQQAGSRQGDTAPAQIAGSTRGGGTVLVLLTDGGNNAGAMPPEQAAKLAADAGLRIYTIGVGAAAQRGFFGLGGGNEDLDEDTLKAIAQTTGGAYFRATDADALQEVYARIDQLEPSAGREQWYRPSSEWFSWPLGLALLLSLPAVLLRERAWT